MPKSLCSFPLVFVFTFFLLGIFALPNSAYCFPADFDGDGKADLVVFRPSEGNWYVSPSSGHCPPCFRQSGGGCVSQWGLPGDIPISGNYDSDALADLTVWRPSTQNWWVEFSSYCGSVQVPMGLPGDRPTELNVDYTNAVSELILWRESNRSWYVRSSIPPYNTKKYYSWQRYPDVVDPSFLVTAQYFPAAAGQYAAGPALYENRDLKQYGGYQGQWTILNITKSGVITPITLKQLQNVNDLTDVISVGGNFGGQASNKADYVFWDRATGIWTIYYNGGPSAPTTVQWGVSIDTPLAGDFDGDGIDDFTVWRGSGAWVGTWFVRPSTHVCPPYMTPYGSTGGCYKQWGLQGDIPVM